MTHKQPFNYYIASCDKEGGIYRCHMENGILSVKGFTPMDRPMYMIEREGKMLVILRAPLENGESGLLFYGIADNGSLTDPSESISTLGVCACHLEAEGKDVYCANYLSGNVFKAPDKTVRHSGKGPDPTRQEAPHTHFVGLTPDNKYLCVTDLGLDKIFVYNRDLTLNSVADMPSGHGPRHLAFHKNGQDVFCINELASTLSHLKYQEGRLTLCSTVDALPKGFEGKSIAAAIRVVGDKVYVSNRGHDSVAVFDFVNSRLVFEKHISVYGNGPRDFIVDGEFIIAANENSNNVSVIEESSGRLVSSLEMTAPLCIVKI